MKHVERVLQSLLAALAFATLMGVSVAQARAETAPALDPARIDALFGAFTERRPGCAAAVVRDGRTIYARGFGLADLSHRAPIGPDTVFEIASISKQFTALAVLLLEADGKLRLDDSVQQHLPEVARLITQPISLRQLLHHTGGLVGYQELMELAGVAFEDVVRPADVLRTIAVLPALHSPPGTRFSYSDTGYFLLAQVVARLGGGSLDAFLQKRVFGPLGMTSTYVYNDHRRVVPRRARAYEPIAGQQAWKLNESNWVMDGDAGVHSTVLDLARWSAEVTRPRVLPPAVIESLRTPGRLNDGSPMVYGMGQYVQPYRRLPRALHSGAWVGYRSMLMHFPTQDTSVAVLCNAADAPAGQLAQRMADEVLAHALAPVPAAAAAGEAVPDVAVAARYEGQFLHEGGFEIVRITASGPGTLRVTIQLGPSPTAATFRPSPGGGWQSPAGTVHLQLDDAGETLSVKSDGRPTETYRRAAAFTPSAEDLAALTGRFRQDALGSELIVSKNGNDLAAQFNPPAGDVQPLQWVGPGHLAHSDYVLRIERDAQGKPIGLVYSRERVRGLRYERQP
jgi:CubicO group peptidase (beta-lactamase class C family)